MISVTAWARPGFCLSPPRMINIGTTLIKLDRKVDAANTYQRYLDAPDTDPAKALEVKKVLADLDKAIGVLEVAVTPSDAELQFDGDDWFPARGIQRHRALRRDTHRLGQRNPRLAIPRREDLAVREALT